MSFRYRDGGRAWPTVLVSVGVILLAALFIVGGCHPQKTAGVRYHCPMHPTYIADRMGDCPICGMRLVPIQNEAPADTVRAESRAPAAAGDGARQVLYYRSPMDPAITSPVPAQDSMGMDFVPVYADEQAAGGAAGVPGLATIRLDAEGTRLAGVTTEAARREPFARTVRAVGTVKADETRVRRVQTRVAGYVERLQANFTGQLIAKGQPVLTLYSPELLSSQEEYLHARETATTFAASTLPEVRSGGEDLVRAARRRLELLDVPEAFIANLEKSGQAERTVTLTAPTSGFITAKEVLAGQRVEPGMELFTVTDLSTVWVEAAFYESEASLVSVGQAATLTLPYDPSLTLQGKVAYIYPYVNADTRTLPVRFDVPNTGGRLKPGMYADVTLRIDQGEQVTVPDDAVMDTGDRQVVFVAGADGTFAPRLVSAGARAGGRTAIVKGLAAGELVATRANFLLDSESRLRAAIADARPAPAQPAGGGAQ